VRDQLVQRAEGIPTYAVETVRALIDRDLVVPRGGAYVLADASGIDLEQIGAPASLQALISARLDRLEPLQRRVVDRASVAGGSVEPELLAELCPDIPDLDDVLAALVRAQIFTVEHNRLSSEVGRYQFVQSALRQVAYATLSRRDRKQIHLQLLDAMSDDASDELAPVAAQHALAAMESAPADPDSGELAARAVDLLVRAAARAQGLGAPGEAVGHLARAAELVTEEERRCDIELAGAGACNDAGLYERAMELADSAAEGFEASGNEDGVALAAAEWGVASVRGRRDLPSAVTRLEPHVRRLRQSRDKDHVLSPVLRSYMLAYHGQGYFDVDLTLLSVTVANRLGDRPGAARAIGNFGVQMLRERQQELGVLLIEKAAAIARECGDLRQLAAWLTNLAATGADHDAVAAARFADEGLAQAHRTGVVDQISTAVINSVITRWAIGDWDGVEELAGSELVLPADGIGVAAVAAAVLDARGRSPEALVAKAQDTPLDDELLGPFLALARALAQAHAGNREATLTAAQAIDEVYEACGVYDDFTLFYGVALALAARYSDAPLMDRLQRIVDEDGSPLPTGLAGHRALLTALDAGRAGVPDDVAEQSFLQALGLYESWGSVVDLARGRAAYGAWLARRGRTEEADAVLRQARETYVALGAVAWLEQLETELAGMRV
jgi:hypothetical protein